MKNCNKYLKISLFLALQIFKNIKTFISLEKKERLPVDEKILQFMKTGIIIEAARNMIIASFCVAACA